MAAEPTSDQVLFATRAWLLTFRREWIRRYGTERGECPVKPFDDYDARDRAVMSRAVKAALVAADPENVARAIASLEDT